MDERIQFHNPPKPKQEIMQVKLTDTADVMMWETFDNGWRVTIVATQLPFNLVVAGGAMDTHYIWNFWVAGREPFTVVAMMPQIKQDVQYMLRDNDALSIEHLRIIQELLVRNTADAEEAPEV